MIAACDTLQGVGMKNTIDIANAAMDSIEHIVQDHGRRVTDCGCLGHGIGFHHYPRHHATHYPRG